MRRDGTCGLAHRYCSTVSKIFSHQHANLAGARNAPNRVVSGSARLTPETH
jgi:hypothetical protein